MDSPQVRAPCLFLIEVPSTATQDDIYDAFDESTQRDISFILVKPKQGSNPMVYQGYVNFHTIMGGPS
jgi:hypothetical protein